MDRRSVLRRLGVWVAVTACVFPYDAVGNGPASVVLLALSQTTVGLMLVFAPLLSTPFVIAFLALDFVTGHAGASLVLWAAWCLTVLVRRPRSWLYGALAVQTVYAVAVYLTEPPGWTQLWGLIGYTVLAATWATAGVQGQVEAQLARVEQLRDENAAAVSRVRAAVVTQVQQAVWPALAEVRSALLAVRHPSSTALAQAAFATVDEAARAAVEALDGALSIPPAPTRPAPVRERGSWWPTRILASAMLAINGTLVVQRAVEANDVAAVVAGVAGAIAAVVLPLHFRLGAVATIVASAVALPLDPRVLCLPIVVMLVMLPARLSSRNLAILASAVSAVFAVLAVVLGGQLDPASVILVGSLAGAAALVGFWYRGFRDRCDELEAEEASLLSSRSRVYATAAASVEREMHDDVRSPLVAMSTQVGAWLDETDPVDAEVLAARLLASADRVERGLTAA